jgi:hypothetical protein
LEYNGETLSAARTEDLYQRWNQNLETHNTVKLMLMSAQIFHIKIREMEQRDELDLLVLKQSANKEM